MLLAGCSGEHQYIEMSKLEKRRTGGNYRSVGAAAAVPQTPSRVVRGRVADSTILTSVRMAGVAGLCPPEDVPAAAMHLQGTFYILKKRCKVTLTEQCISWIPEGSPECE
ncbi:hypothetical protein E2C01_011623 [Portunus trituberculatus]|uniref:Uncharacterized protein n=1 Tax=Portunus trituberculatus TaxID=210409 RepID=A0A5B7DBW6_PORTR|nr:hypothetical protein [Portunus trituberculatus]